MRRAGRPRLNQGFYGSGNIGNLHLAKPQVIYVKHFRLEQYPRIEHKTIERMLPKVPRRLFELGKNAGAAKFVAQYKQSTFE